ncbi:MAG TPA: asparaginase [Firmicutes bacterium]|nr:asparaginase [Candidatus Fermentithermobacillaceae bacterium]
MSGQILHILTTGGTIASRSGRPMAPGAELAGPLREFFPDVEIAVKEVCRIGSSQITLDILRTIRSQVEESFAAGATGVVISHGTDSLEETAYFLDITVARLGPIILTGAMRSLDAISPEGLANLVESCKVALEPESREYGVLVVMNDRIHLAREVTKVHSWLLDAFASPDTGPMGYVSPLGVDFVVGPQKREYAPYRDLEAPVDLIKVSLDSGDRLLRAALDAGAKGIVIESFGYGHLPPGMMDGVRAAIDRGVPVVLTTRCLTGGAPRPGTVHKEGFITTDLSGPKARIKLMLALSLTQNREEIARLFAQRP